MATFSVSRELGMPPSQLYDLAIGPDFQQLRAEHLGGIGLPVVTPLEGRCVRIEMTRRLPPEKLPAAARRFVPKDTAAHQVDEWLDVSDAGAKGRWTAKVPGVPVEISGGYDVHRSGNASVFACTGDVRVGVPVLGKKIASEVAKYLEELARTELDLMESHLAGRA